MTLKCVDPRVKLVEGYHSEALCPYQSLSDPTLWPGSRGQVCGYGVFGGTINFTKGRRVERLFRPAVCCASSVEGESCSLRPIQAL